VSTERDVTRIVRSWLEEGATALPDRVLDAVLDQVPATSQRRPWWPVRTFREMNQALKLAIVAAAVMVVALVGINLMPGSGSVGGPAPSLSPSPSPTLTMLEIGYTSLEAGTYSLGGFPVMVTFDVPAGWSSCSENTVEQGICPGPGSTNSGALGFLVVENVVEDPCASPRTLLDPRVGPSVDDLVTAISNLQGFEATTAVDYTLSGMRGKQFTLTAPTGERCTDITSWATPLRINGMSRGEINEVRILDVGGLRILISIAHSPFDRAEDLAAVLQILDSVQFWTAASSPSPST
jgi:hypothetical protein